jgi:hypothetical protein
MSSKRKKGESIDRGRMSSKRKEGKEERKKLLATHLSSSHGSYTFPTKARQRLIVTSRLSSLPPYRPLQPPLAQESPIKSFIDVFIDSSFRCEIDQQTADSWELIRCQILL